ncbi:hypothetical protein C0Q70_05111 [Pomacea canaliculata]|uniref:C2 domain-containing protein n=1 Tax=Pomacea canaliculata TaxID=400727 RepID=A0A2T7PKB6_POMCA|nr:hypothetical protein C0Q70_05111 [Pomacea canaliculata]
MPGRLKVRLLGARDLPVMDRASDLTDAFVEVRFDGEMFKTEVCKKSLNPQWNSDWFKFEVDDEVLQDEPLDIRVLDYDTYSAHDAIGKVYIDLNPLLTRDLPCTINGWFPIYDTMHGIRGELNVQVKVELFSDLNKFRQSSCGIQFFCTAAVPSGYALQGVQGFVEELVVNDDPEYQWIDKIRTPRASNEARQRLFSKLSASNKIISKTSAWIHYVPAACSVRLESKVMEMGGNAVLGYTQNFDLEGESGIVVRAIGTAVTLAKLHSAQHSPIGVSPLKDLGQEDDRGFDFLSSSPLPQDTNQPGSPPLAINRHSNSPARVSGSGGGNNYSSRRLSDSDVGSPPRANSLTGSYSSGINIGVTPRAPPPCNAINQQNIDLLEYPFFTMRSYPPGFIVSLGSMVSARSVKLLDKIDNPEEPETRDMWWNEIRTEIRSHARSMNCHAVLGYTEQTAICDEIIILSASGTAARISFHIGPSGQVGQSSHLLQAPALIVPNAAVPSVDRQQSSEREKDKERRLTVDIALANQLAQMRLLAASEGSEKLSSKCSVCHIPYHAHNLPFPINLTLCTICKKRRVPDILFTTIDPPKEIPVVSHGSLVQARVCRAKSKGKGSEATAKDVSDSLPFLEYELHSQLINKLKMRGLNSLFGLKIQICLGETMITALATGTGVFLSPMPQPPLPKLSTQVQVATQEENRDLVELQARINGIVQQHRQRLSLEMAVNQNIHAPVTDESDEEQSDLEMPITSKDTFVLEIDDPKDEILSLILQDSVPPTGFEVCSTQYPPGIPPDRLTGHLQMFTQMAVIRYLPHINSKLEFGDIFEMLLRRMYFKLRRLAPCVLTDLNFTMEVPDEDEVQVAVTGCCLGVGDPQPQNTLLTLSANVKHPVAGTSAQAAGQTDDMMFNLEVDGEVAPAAAAKVSSSIEISSGPHLTSCNPIVKQRVGVEITPLPTVIGGQIVKYLGNHNFFLIRESTSVKECGGLGGFMQRFIGEVLAIVRGHVSALGGNALVGYQMSHCVLFSNLHKNQAQCLINVCGDAVQISYDCEPVQVDFPSSLNTPNIVTQSYAEASS